MTAKQRITDSVETALGLADGVLSSWILSTCEDDDPLRERRYSERLACPNDHPLERWMNWNRRSFSFNSPFGACPDLQRVSAPAKKSTPSWSSRTANSDLCASGAIQPWSAGTTSEYFNRLLQRLWPTVMGFSLDTPWDRLPAATSRKAVLHGSQRAGAHVTYRNRYGRQRSYYAEFEGVIPVPGAACSSRPIPTSPGRSTRATCERCPVRCACGTRLKPVILAVTLEHGDLRACEHRRSCRPVCRSRTRPRFFPGPTCCPNGTG